MFLFCFAGFGCTNALLIYEAFPLQVEGVKASTLNLLISVVVGGGSSFFSGGGGPRFFFLGWVGVRN